MLQMHGADTFAAQHDGTRLELLHNLLSGLPLSERQALLQQIVTHEGFAGNWYEMMVGLLSSLDTQDGVALLKQQMARRTPRAPACHTRRMSAAHRPPP